ESILHNHGYQIATANSGATALNLADEIMPDLILLDVMMPGMNGFEVCRRLRATPKLAEVPIIILTALDDRASRLQGIEAGADDFLTKPIDRQELRLRVKTILRLDRYRTLLTQRENLSQMAERVITAQEEERKRLSRELHDDLGQALIAHILELKNLQSQTNLNHEFEKLIEDTNHIINRMRQLAQDMRPALLDTLGLVSALETYSREFGLRAKLPVTFEADGEIPKLSDVHSITLYRTLQESLTNIIKHSNATQVWVELNVDEHHTILTVQDNGVGFVSTTQNGMGISNLRERLALVGGELAISSAVSKGTIISARLPLEETSQTELAI
ncbi:MAG: response regulator, partial [Anaerolineales bacterium]|nr:response regulator [Anaerolineales bacterium]